MSIEVCTVYAPRPDHPGWRDWLPLLAAQRASALRVEHVHRVITDGDLDTSVYDVVKTELPQSLMKAMIAGVIKRLQLGGKNHIVFVDIDCLVLVKLNAVFKRSVFDIGLTYRNNDISPINNGVMYVHALGIRKALRFFQAALEICEDHWGGDQEAISKIAAPVPNDFTVEERCGCAVKFLSMKRYNCVPKAPLAPLGGFIGHFKGDAKAWMLGYAKEYLK